MNNKLKRALYESIMKNVSKNVKQTLNEEYDDQLNEGKFKNMLKTGALAAGLTFGAPAAHMGGSQALAQKSGVNTEMSVTANYDYSTIKIVLDSIPSSYEDYECICPVILVNEPVTISQNSVNYKLCMDALDNLDNLKIKYLSTGITNANYNLNYNKTDKISLAIIFMLRENDNISRIEIYTANNLSVSKVRTGILYSDLKKVYEKNYKTTGIDDVETSNDEVQQSQKAVKKIENGKIVIYKGGHKYTAGGALIENKKALYNSIMKNVAKQVKKTLNEELREPGTGSFVPAVNNDETDDSFFATLDPIGAGEYWLNSDDAVYIIWYDEDEDEWVVETEGGDYVCSLENDESTQEAIENCDDETLLDWILEDDEY